MAAGTVPWAPVRTPSKARLVPGVIVAAIAVIILALPPLVAIAPTFVIAIWASIECARLGRRIDLYRWGSVVPLEGGIICLWPVAMLVLMLHNRGLAVLAVACAFVADVGAIAAGRLWGRHKIAPRISPGKTYEGVAGGLVAALIAGLVINGVFHLHMVWPRLFGAVIIIMLAGVTGDLMESKLKRRAGVKDSGRVLCGHGGVLDRCDALFATTMATTLLAMLNYF